MEIDHAVVRSTLLVLAALILAGGSGAGAQELTREAITRTPTPISSVSFTPFETGMTIDGKPLAVNLVWVSVVPPSHAVGLARSGNAAIGNSAVNVYAPNGLADGVYSVRFTIGWVNFPSTVAILGFNRVLITTCSVQAQTSTDPNAPVQVCEATGLRVAGTPFTARLEVTDGTANAQVQVTRITVNRYR